MNDFEDSQKYPELLDPPFLYNPRIDRRKSSERERQVGLQISDHQYGADLTELQKIDPESYRMVIYSWA